MRAASNEVSYENSFTSGPGTVDDNFNQDLFSTLFEPMGSKKFNSGSQVRDDSELSFTPLELTAGIERVEEKDDKIPPSGEKRLISEVFERRAKKILEDEDVQKYLKAPSLLRDGLDQNPNTRAMIRDLREIVSFSIKTANILKEDCPCKELAEKLFIDPKTGESCGVLDLQKQFQELNRKIADLQKSDPETYRNALKELEKDWIRNLRKVPDTLNLEEKVLNNYYREAVGDDGEKLAGEFVRLRKSYVESLKENLKDGQSRYDFEALATGSRNSKGLPRIGGHEVELGKYSPKIHDAWNEIEKFRASKGGAHAITYVLVLDEIRAMRDDATPLLKLLDK